MGDVRLLLRNERVLRRIDHPNASYSVTGTLECNCCRILVKSDGEAWNKHLTSTQHAMRAERLRLNQSKPLNQKQTGTDVHGSSEGSRKRKASEDDENSRKRTRPIIKPPNSPYNEILEVNRAVKPSQSSNPPQSVSAYTNSQKPTKQPAEQLVDEAEWAAFERDIATSPPSADIGPSALMAQATISSAPISAAELAAQETKDARVLGRERGEAELDAEKEDAARLLEEELDELEGLDERVRLLRARREALRTIEERGKDEFVRPSEDARGLGSELVDRISDEDEETSDDEDFDDWRFGR